MKRTLLLTILIWVAAVSISHGSIQDEYNPVFTANKTELLDWLKPLNLSPVILLDVASKAEWHDINRHILKHYIAISIIYGIDKGYGYSVGPFEGTLYLVPTGDGNIKWFKITGAITFYSHYGSNLIRKGGLDGTVNLGVDPF